MGRRAAGPYSEGRAISMLGRGGGPDVRVVWSHSLTLPPSHFQTHIESNGATARLRLSGELDLACQPHLDAILRELEQESEHVILDLGGLSFIDSTGLRTILVAWHRTREDGVKLTVVPGAEPVWRTLRMTGLDRVLPIAEDA
jgi:anti-anti-sigma factor